MTNYHNKLEVKPTFNLEYWVGSKHMETIGRNIPFRMCKGLSINLKRLQNYSMGKFVIKPNK